MPKALDADAAAADMLDKGLLPQVPYPGSREPWECLCTRCGTRIWPRYCNAVRARWGCVQCRADAALGRDRVPEDVARAEMAAAGWRPVAAYTAAHAAWESECMTCGRLSRPTLVHVRRGRRCQRCTLLENGAKRATSDADARAAAAVVGLVPKTQYPGRNDIPWDCTCSVCGSSVSPTYGAIQQGRGCQRCSWDRVKTLSLHTEDPAVVYLAVHSELGAVKVGAAGAHTKRLYRLSLSGWEIIQSWKCATGSIALVAESAVLQEWRRSGAGFGVTGEQMPNGGHTETAPLEQVDIDRAFALVKGVIGEM